MPTRTRTGLGDEKSRSCIDATALATVAAVSDGHFLHSIPS